MEVISSIRNPTNTTARTITPATNWTSSNEQTYSTTDGVRNGVFYRSISSTTVTDVSSTALSGNTLGSMTAVSINALSKKYRSNVSSGNWSTLATWQQSMNNGTTWVSATIVPTNSDSLVTILNGSTITLAAAATVKNITINTIDKRKTG